MGQALSRSESREVALRLIFANSDWRETMGLAMGDKFAPEPERQYIEKVVQCAKTRTEEIDQKIKAQLKDWTLDRLKQTDLAVLRLAMAEILLGEVPVPVVINEAVNLAKKYGEQTSGAFVNGILAKITE